MRSRHSPLSLSISILLNCLFGLAVLAGSAVAADDSPATQSRLPNAIQTVLALLDVPEHKLDFARAKLTIDNLIDPAIDVEASLSEIDGMVQAIWGMVGPSASSMEKVAAIRTYIYKSGPWNGYRPYQYDHDDPLGIHLPNKLIPNYVASRRGNCITMPFLFIMLADRMGVNVTASTAPLHVMVKFTDDATGRTYNLETTSGALPAREVWYRQNMPMTDRAISNGLYLRTLTRKETVAVMATVLVEHYLDRGQYEKSIAAADAVLRYYPDYAYTLVKKGTAYYHLLNENYYKKYPTPRDIPFMEQSRFIHWSESNRLAFERAEALGWRPEGQVR